MRNDQGYYLWKDKKIDLEEDHYDTHVQILNPGVKQKLEQNLDKHLDQQLDKLLYYHLGYNLSGHVELDSNQDHYMKFWQTWEKYLDCHLN